jgi:hypothetical protein
MSVDRYLYLCSILHTGKDDEIDNDDALWKVRFFVDRLNQNFESSWSLGQEISIDESLMLYRGHHSLIRYIPNKAARFGFKIFALACSDTGYMYRFLFDCGSKTRYLPDCPAALNKPGQIVWTLLKGARPAYSRLGLGHILGVDNYYTCINTLYELHKNRTDFLGTVRKNRTKLPKSVLTKKWKKAEKGYRVIKHCFPAYLVNWMDKKPVVMISTISNAELTSDSRGKPAVIHEYNRIMPGIDKNDQMKFGRKLARRRVKKYYRNIFYHLLDTTLINCFIYYKNTPIEGRSRTTHHKFRLLLASELILKYQKKNVTLEPTTEGAEEHVQREVSTTNDNPTPLHTPQYVQTRKRCTVCYATDEKLERKTNWSCDACGDKFYCLNKERNCFKSYHEENSVLLGLRKQIRRSTRNAQN